MIKVKITLMDRRQKLHKSAGKITIALDFGILPKVRLIDERISVLFQHYGKCERSSMGFLGLFSN